MRVIWIIPPLDREVAEDRPVESAQSCRENGHRPGGMRPDHPARGYRDLRAGWTVGLAPGRHLRGWVRSLDVNETFRELVKGGEDLRLIPTRARDSGRCRHISHDPQYRPTYFQPMWTNWLAREVRLPAAWLGMVCAPAVPMRAEEGAGL